MWAWHKSLEMRKVSHVRFGTVACCFVKADKRNVWGVKGQKRRIETTNDALKKCLKENSEWMSSIKHSIRSLWVKSITPAVSIVSMAHVFAGSEEVRRLDWNGTCMAGVVSCQGGEAHFDLYLSSSYFMDIFLILSVGCVPDHLIVFLRHRWN